MIRVAQVSDAEGIAQVQVDTWRAAYAGLMPDEVLAGQSYENRTRQWQEMLSNYSANRKAVIAEDSDRAIIGFVAAGQPLEAQADFAGEIYALYVLPKAQGQGIGRKLVQAAAAELLKMGMASMFLWVLGSNQSGRGFYEAIGGAKITERNFTIGGAVLPEVAYGWPDIHTLIVHN